MDIKRRLRRAINAMGFDVQRISHPRNAGGSIDDPFAPVETCQIGALSTIYHVFFEPGSPGLYVEVGAYDGVTYSNTYQLSRLGWQGHLIEPVPEHASAARSAYEGCPNIEVHELAIGADDGWVQIVLGAEYSTIDQETADAHAAFSWSSQRMQNRTTRVPQIKFDRFLEERGIAPGSIDLLVVDVEGYETQVFAGFDLARWRPSMLIIELTDIHAAYEFSRSRSGQLHLEILDAGYVTVYKDSSNSIFVTQELFRQRVLR